MPNTRIPDLPSLILKLGLIGLLNQKKYVQKIRDI